MDSGPDTKSSSPIYCHPSNASLDSNHPSPKCLVIGSSETKKKRWCNHSNNSESEVEYMFEKSFLYQKREVSDDWCLPNHVELFKEYYQLEDLQNLNIKLNKIKSKLNDYVLEDWAQHTKRQNPAGEIIWRLKTETQAEFVTIAWSKMYEILSKFPELIRGPQINSLHLCEAPGAFIASLNHYLYTNYDKNEVKWKWLATTLNPYYEGNPFSKMIMDDRFLLYTLDNWIFYKNFTGNIIDQENLKEMQQTCETRLREVHLITADGSIDCTESPECQEQKVALLHYAEVITALTILAEGGSFIIKVFTMFEASSVCQLFLLNCAFEKVHVFKPCTSKRGNSEVYVVCVNYKKQTKNLLEIVDKMKLKLNLENSMLWPLFPKSSLPFDFLAQHEICCRIFMNHQINSIEQNIYSYEIRPHKMIVNQLQNLRKAVSKEFYKRYKIKKLQEELKIRNKFKFIVEEGYRNQLHKGSHTEREIIKEMSKEEQVFQLRKQLNDLEKVLTENLQLNELKMKFLTSHTDEAAKVSLMVHRGQAVTSLNSSMFASVHLLSMRSKLNDLLPNVSCDVLWIQQPKVSYNSNDALVSIYFNDFVPPCGKFSIQQENFFTDLISKLLSTQPKELRFINMPFLTHYAVSILYYLSYFAYSKVLFSFASSKFEIILSFPNYNFNECMQTLQTESSTSQDQDILSFFSLTHLHRNEFNKTLCAFNNMLLLQNYKHLLNK